ncbi:hypothetical protein MTsPCn3_32800 [Erythrobacter sp. MTPC3]
MVDGARSTNAQLNAMRSLWPTFQGRRHGNGLVTWQGALKPRAQVYAVNVFWWPGKIDRPYVVVADPTIEPRSGGSYEEIPHLMFDSENPRQSGLCLFDPDGHEWSDADLIAETTIGWASEWLHYYELWHVSGEWLAPGVGYESVAQMNQTEAEIVREVIADVH